MRVVLDSNVYISALLVGRGCEEILMLARARVIELLLSEAILEEVAAVLKKKFHWEPADIRMLSEELRESCTMVHGGAGTVEFPPDPADAKILSCAVEGRADVIVTGDRKHLLPLMRYKGIPIVSPAAFLEQIG